MNSVQKVWRISGNFYYLFITLLATVLFIPTANAGPACGGRFIGKTIRIIVPHAPGGGYDIYSRMIAPYYAKATGAKLIVENWPGGKGQIGINKITSSAPDGLTLGLINAPKTITSHLLGDPGAANLLEDLQIFARVARSRHVWVVDPIAGIDSADQIMSANPPMVFGATDKRSSGFLATLLTTEFLQFEFDALVGIGGSKKRILALIRGDIDFFSLSFSSLRTELESGDIKAVLQITATPISDHAVLENVPLLGGKDGFAAKRARQLGTNVQQAMELASATEAFIGAGRIIVGPKAFESELASCIEQTFVTVLNGPAFRSDAEQLYRPLDVASGRETVASLTSSLSQVANYIGLLEQNALKFDQ